MTIFWTCNGRDKAVGRERHRRQSAKNLMAFKNSFAGFGKILLDRFAFDRDTVDRVTKGEEYMYTMKNRRTSSAVLVMNKGWVSFIEGAKCLKCVARHAFIRD